MKKKHIYLLVVLSLLFFVIVYNWSLISYGLLQGKGQYEVLRKAKPISYYLNAPEFPDSLKGKLKLLDRIKTYAIEAWDLPASDQYNTLYNQEGKDILWVITAAYPYKMRDYLWQFPFLGEVSYKGFFEYEKAVSEAKVLEEKGFDTRIRVVGAWSTLGWFQDPLLSNMLNRSEGKLAEVIFHELIHDVVYIKDSTDFNENLANFFGKRMAQLYLAEMGSAERLREYIERTNDEAHLNEFMNEQVKELDSIFIQNQPLPIHLKDSLKKEFFKRMKLRLKKEQFNQEGFAASIYENEALNNAHLLAFNRYGGYQVQLTHQLEHDFDGELLPMLAHYKFIYSKE